MRMLLLLVAAMGWFYTVTPPDGSLLLIVGPYNSEFGCKDWLGSALYLHGPLCHNHPSADHCKPIGAGYAAPGVASGTCYAERDVDVPAGGYGFFWYPFQGGGQIIGGHWGPAKCGRMRRKYVAANGDAGIAGSGCFFSGQTFE